VPSSLIIVALVVAWLVVLGSDERAQSVQEVTKTSDTAMAARVVHGGPEDVEEEPGQSVDEFRDRNPPTTTTATTTRTHGPTARGAAGSTPKPPPPAPRAPSTGLPQRAVLAAARARRAQRPGLANRPAHRLVGHGGVDLLLVGYLAYLRRQVRIEPTCANAAGPDAWPAGVASRERPETVSWERDTISRRQAIRTTSARPGCSVSIVGGHAERGSIAATPWTPACSRMTDGAPARNPRHGAAHLV